LAASNPPLINFVFTRDFSNYLDHESRRAHRGLREELERVIAAGKSSGDVRSGSVEVWTDVWLRLTTLVLERAAGEEWSGAHSAPRQVMDAAWAAIQAQ
jgi:hypothetical protein